MRKRHCFAAFVALFAAGCTKSDPPTSPFYTRSSGALALSNDDALLYAVETDNDLLVVVDRARQEKVAEVKVGARPEQVAVGPDDTIYVTNRGSRSLSVIRRDDWTVAKTVSVGVEPVGVAASPDGDTVFVVNGASTSDAAVGSLMAIDAARLEVQWELAVGNEPRGVRLLEGRRAAVTLYHEGDVVFVDTAAPRVSQPGTGIYAQANAASLRANEASGHSTRQTFHPRGLAALAISTDGERLYAPGILSLESAIVVPPSAGGYYGNGGPCSSGAVASAGLFTLIGESGAPLVDDVTDCSGAGSLRARDFPPTALSSSGVQGPSAAVVDVNGEWLYVVNRETNNVHVVRTSRTEDKPDRFLVGVGAGPSGIALTRDGKQAFVLNAFDHTLSTLRSQEDGALVAQPHPLQIASDSLSPSAAAGRRLFYAAADARLSNQASGISCATCHLEGRDDSHVWKFPDGPRQTPSLAGRNTTSTGPFHWSGEFATLEDFLDHTVRRRMGGQGLNRRMVTDLSAFLDTLPAADNPHRLPTPSAAQRHGAELFKSATCAGCHAGASFTNNTFADVGTLVTGGELPDAVSKLREGGLNVPSLLGLARSAPYLHDGSALDLKARLLKDKQSNRHGLTADLSSGDMDDLVAYLKTL